MHAGGVSGGGGGYGKKDPFEVSKMLLSRFEKCLDYLRRKSILLLSKVYSLGRKHMILLAK